MEITFSSLNWRENLRNVIVLKYRSALCLSQSIKHSFPIQTTFVSDLSLIIACCSESPVLLLEPLVVILKNINILFFSCSEESWFMVRYSVLSLPYVSSSWVLISCRHEKERPYEGVRMKAWNLMIKELYI